MAADDRGSHLRPVPDDEGAPTPPHNSDAEKAVLGAILRDKGALAQVSEILNPADFWQPGHETIYATALTLYSTLKPVDPITVAHKLGDQLGRVGGHVYLTQLHFDALAIFDPSYHAEIVATMAARRRLGAHHLAQYQLAYSDAPATVEELHDKALADLLDIPRGVPGVDNHSAHYWDAIDLGDIIDHGETLTQPTQLARTDGQCLLYPGAVHSVAGEPESGKTWLALIAAAQCLRVGGSVVYVDFEDRAGRVVPRLINLGVPREAIRERFHYIRPTAAIDSKGRDILARHCKAADLGIIDGVTEAMTMHGLSLMDNEDAARYLDLLPRAMADHGCAVLQIDHVVKNADNQGRWSIGAQHKLAGIDGAAYLIKVREPFGRGKVGRATISLSKDREGAIREVTEGIAVAQLVLDSRGGSLLAEVQPPEAAQRTESGRWKPTHLMQKISLIVEVTPGISGRQIEEQVIGKSNHIRAALEALLEDEYLVRERDGRTYKHVSIRPYREGDTEEEDPS